MYKYVVDVFRTAQKVGTVREIEMKEVSKWAPKHIEISGKTADGEVFSLTLNVGMRLKDQEGD